jgi:hypothetical protein
MLLLQQQPIRPRWNFRRLLSSSQCSFLTIIMIIMTAVFLRIPTVDSFPSGAGSCDTGGAVGGYHLESYTKGNNSSTLLSNNHTKSSIRCIQTGTLRHAGMEVVIGGNRILSDTQPIQFLQSHTEYTIQIYTITSIFRGVFIRLSHADATRPIDLSGMLRTTDPLLQMATIVCTDPTVAVGVTHRSSIDKDLVYATMQLDDLGNTTVTRNTTTTYILEITVVGMNNEHGSLYAYSSYELQLSNSSTVQEEVIMAGGRYDDDDDDVDDDSILYQGGTAETTTGTTASKTTGQDEDNSPNSKSSSSSSRTSVIIGFSVVLATLTVVLLSLALKARLR